jgi:uncharacterized protein (DUF362 family)
MNVHHTDRITNLSRRQFLRLSALLAGVAALKPCESVVAGSSPSKPKVIHVYCQRATHWDFLTGWWGDHVDQGVVSEMVDRGVMELTGRNSRPAAWQALLPDYVAGQRVAIKVNFNNAQSPADADNSIDATIEPVNAIIAGLKEIGVAASDIWVYDAVRAIPTRFKNGCDHPGVQFSGDSSSNHQGFSSTQKVTFRPPAGGPSLGAQSISNVLVNAKYLINVPLMKKHCCAWVTLSFKNHFGSIAHCAALHGYTFPYEDDYTSAYSPLVDIYKNRHFGAKTVLTVGDGLYGSRGSQDSAPERWATFDSDSPRSLFFSQDPVAIDSVMYDFLDDEAPVRPHGDDYLARAAQVGLGVFEHRNPEASNREDWYSQIDYRYLDLDNYVKLRGLWRDGVAYLEWNRPSDPDLVGYRVCYSSTTGGDLDQGSSPINVSDPGQVSVEFTGLTLYSLYEFWIEPYRTGGAALGKSNHLPLMATDIVGRLPLVLAG